MFHSMTQVLAISWPGPFEMMLLAGLGLLIFGKRLPEVGKNIGRGIVEFKKGLKEAEQEITSEPVTAPPANTQQTLAPKYKFDPYTGKPIDDNTPASS
jgi:sec-independent protein translocase protein TatA